jgi:hypothetical protein
MGKTEFVKLLGHKVHLRDLYTDGVFYLDVRPI